MLNLLIGNLNLIKDEKCHEQTWFDFLLSKNESKVNDETVINFFWISFFIG